MEGGRGHGMEKCEDESVSREPVNPWCKGYEEDYI
jgi:hypothetical protein